MGRGRRPNPNLPLWKEAVTEGRSLGLSFSEIAAGLDVSAARLCQIAQDLGLPHTPRPRAKHTGPDPLTEEMAALYLSTRSGHAVAKAFGTTPSSVYARMHKAGVTLPPESLWEKLAKRFTFTFGCWVWHGPRHVGYGVFPCVPGGRSRLAHRLTYEYLVGEIPEGLELDHLCRTPECVNPYHLEPVTHLENVRRGLRGGRKPKVAR